MLMPEQEVELQGNHCRIVMESWVGGRNAPRRLGGQRKGRGVLIAERTEQRGWISFSG